MDWLKRLLDDEGISVEKGFSDSLLDRGKELCLEHFQKDTLIDHVQMAIDIVKSNPSLMPNELTRERFTRQNAKDVAKYLCTTITRYIYLRLDNRNVPDFAEYYINLCHRGAYVWKDNQYSLYKNEHLLMKEYLDKDTFCELENVKVKDGKVQNIINNSHVKLVMIRNNRNSHTFLGIIENGSIYRLDTYHKGKIGKKFNGKMRYFYYYLTGVNDEP